MASRWQHVKASARLRFRSARSWFRSARPGAILGAVAGLLVSLLVWFLQGLLEPTLQAKGIDFAKWYGALPAGAQISFVLLGKGKASTGEEVIDIYVTNAGTETAIVNYLQVCRPWGNGAIAKQTGTDANGDPIYLSINIDCPPAKGTSDHRTMSDLFHDSYPGWGIGCSANPPLGVLPLLEGSRVVPAGGATELRFEGLGGTLVFSREGVGPHYMNEVMNTGAVGDYFRPCVVSLGTSAGAITRIAWCTADQESVPPRVDDACKLPFFPAPKRGSPEEAALQRRESENR